jgi:hypothetical protein
MAMRNKIASGVLACVVGTAAAGFTIPASASDAGAFIGGVFATKLIEGVQEQNEAEERQAAATEQMAAQQRAAAPAGGSAEQQLSELKSMQAKGLISKQEYNQKKKQILDSM